jgi:AsmA protein
VAPEGTRADAINLTAPAIGVITGAGTVSPEDWRRGPGLGGSTGGGIPFSIQGITSNPSFVPDVSAVAGRVAKGAVQNAVSGKTAGTQALGGLLGRKKPK